LVMRWGDLWACRRGFLGGDVGQLLEVGTVGATYALARWAVFNFPQNRIPALIGDNPEGEQSPGKAACPENPHRP
jgi:hypothetical protein